MHHCHNSPGLRLGLAFTAVALLCGCPGGPRPVAKDKVDTQPTDAGTEPSDAGSTIDVHGDSTADSEDSAGTPDDGGPTDIGDAQIPDPDSSDSGDVAHDTADTPPSDAGCSQNKAICDDTNPCTLDECNNATGACTHAGAAKDGDSCDDGSACTTGEKCAAGACTGGNKKACDDGSPCTDDSCDDAKGCQTTPNSATCDDGNACTTGDKCADGSCKGGATAVCDDGNTCTEDSCDKTKGCTSIAAQDGAVCSDDKTCTAGDACKASACTAGPAMLWDKTLPQSGGGFSADALAATPGGTYFGVGQAVSTTVSHARLMFIAPSGAVVCDKPLSASGNHDLITDLTAMPGGDAILTGVFAWQHPSTGAWPSLVWVLRVKPDCTVTWSQTTKKVTGYNYGWRSVPDGTDVITVGSLAMDSVSNATRRAMIMRANAATGKIAWQKTHAEGLRASAVAVVDAKHGGGYLATTMSAGVADAGLLRLTTNGDKSWFVVAPKTSGSDRLFRILALPGGDFLAGGNSAGKASGKGKTDIWLLRVDPKGDTIWEQTYGSPGTELLGGLVATAKGFAFSGLHGAKGTGKEDGWLVEVDASGNQLWEKKYDTGGEDVFYDLDTVPWAPASYVVGGRKGGGPSPWALQVDAKGSAQCL